LIKTLVTIGLLAALGLAAVAAADPLVSGSATATFSAANDGTSPLNVVEQGAGSASVAFDSDHGATVTHAPTPFEVERFVLAAAGFATSIDPPASGGIDVNVAAGANGSACDVGTAGVGCGGLPP
jgi:hypothetical protein